MQIPYNLTTKEALAEFNTDPDTGLSQKEVEKRRAQYGENSLKIKDRSLLSKILEPFLDIFMVILLAALALSLIQGAFIDSALIGVIVVIDAVVFYAQQFSTERILRNLKQQTVQQISVLRNSERTKIDARELVPGDIVILQEGDKIPADGRILEESGLLANESMLTGESEPVEKNASKLSGERKVYEQRNMVFSGSFLITGSGKMLVVATGNDTEYGRIASLASSAESLSPVQEKINKLVAKIAIVVVSLAAIVLILSLIRGEPLLEALKFTLAMIVSAVPEGLPLAISIILALGAKRMAKKRALIKEMRAIESIGIITTIASDKTGTLTENKLSIQKLWSLDNDKDLAKFMAESCLPEPMISDPLDVAINSYLKKHHPHLTDIGPIRSYPFDQSLKISGNLYATTSGSLHLAIKGAPETILERSRLSSANHSIVEAKVNELSGRGYRVIAVASAAAPREVTELGNLPKDQQFKFLGILAIADSIRPEAIPAIKSAKAAGVSVKMITGDHFQTALEIGRELGIVEDETEVFDCSKISDISDDDLAQIVKNTTVFARVTPEDKYKILTALKKDEVTAMTGDGVNDVPALTNAHIGIAMGSSPSIVQDAGDIILMDDNFKNIVEAMKEGRVILTNIRRMLVYLLATNAGEVLTIITSLIIGLGHFLAPIQLLWINLVTDSIMVIPIGLEPAERHFLRTKPESKDAPILSSKLITRMIIMSVTMAILTISTYLLAKSRFSTEVASSLAFTALVVMQWANALNTRGLHESFVKRFKTRSRKFYFALTAAVAIQLFAIFTPAGRTLLHLAELPLLPLGLTVLVAFIIPILTVEIHKLLTKKS
jgi:Ca2+-transporting ATPase